MAETLIKTSLVSSWHGNRNQQRQRVSMVPKTCSFNTGVKSFPSLKLKSQLLRSSSSFSSEFHGKKTIFRVNRSTPKRVNSQFSVSAAPKVGHKFQYIPFWFSHLNLILLCFNFCFVAIIKTLLVYRNYVNFSDNPYDFIIF